MLGIALLTSFLALSAPQEAPPGLVLVKGGKTKVGSNADQIEKVILAREELRNTLVSQTPQHTVQVDDFYLMPTEVTNEQYAEYVTATKVKPPRSWGAKALLAGQAAFLEEQGKAKQEAKAAGQNFVTKIFDPELWWDENWKDVPWEIPQAELAHPVVFVNYADAQHYARWAGLRLMTEFEFQRAGRGDTGRDFPWGDDWDDKKYCQSLHIGKDQSVPVGSFPDGAVNGIYDLSGNVWEWTSSPYTEYPGYKPLRLNVKGQKRVIDCVAPFDPNQRVLVSGSYQVENFGVRIATRMNSDRNQSTSALGFRCAASYFDKKPNIGADAASWIIADDLVMSTLGDTQLAPPNSTILRKWTSKPGTAKVKGYAVITEYQHLLACPRENVRATTVNDLTTTTAKEAPIFIGFIDVPRPMEHPLLDAGSYFIAWRGAGKLPEAEEAEKQGIEFGGAQEEETPFHKVTGFNPDKDSFIFYSRDGRPQAAIEAPPIAIEKYHDSTIKIEPFVPPDPKKLPKDAPPPRQVDTLRFQIVVPSSVSTSKGVTFDLPIEVKMGTYDSSWK